MLNGTVTLGTLDGANVEIAAEAGEENNYIFGLTVEEIEQLKPNYDPVKYYESNPLFKRVVDTLIDGTVSDDGTGMFEELYNALLKGASWHQPDHYFLLADFDDYLRTKLRANADYSDRTAFSRKCWMNLSSAGKFSSDRTIQQYAAKIWEIEQIQ